MLWYGGIMSHHNISRSCTIFDRPRLGGLVRRTGNALNETPRVLQCHGTNIQSRTLAVKSSNTSLSDRFLHPTFTKEVD